MAALSWIVIIQRRRCHSVPIHRVYWTSILLNKSLARPINAILFAACCSIGAIAVRPTHAMAQVTQSSAVAEAMSRRDSGDFKGAVAVLQAHLASYPEDGDALRLLAETLYWQKDFAGVPPGQACLG